MGFPQSLDMRDKMPTWVHAGALAEGGWAADRAQEPELGRGEGQARAGPSLCSPISAQGSKESENSTFEPKYMEVCLARNIFYLS